MGETILLPVDGSPLSMRAIEFVGDEHPEAAVHLLYVLDRADSEYSFDGTTFSIEFGHRFDELPERGQRVLEDARETAGAAGLTVAETAVAVGRPAGEIVAYASEHGIDHIVLGSHGRTGLSRLLLGSVTERVLRNSTVPVTIIR